MTNESTTEQKVYLVLIKTYDMLTQKHLHDKFCEIFSDPKDAGKFVFENKHMTEQNDTVKECFEIRMKKV